MTTTPDSNELHYRHALRRIYRFIIVLSVTGTVVAAWLGGGSWGVGFACGAIVSAVNFRWLHRMADSLGPDPKQKPRKSLAVLLSLRYVLFGAVGYVIVRYFKFNIMAALVGLFVAVAAVLIEILYELIYVRT